MAIKASEPSRNPNSTPRSAGNNNPSKTSVRSSSKSGSGKPSTSMPAHSNPFNGGGGGGGGSSSSSAAASSSSYRLDTSVATTSASTGASLSSFRDALPRNTQIYDFSEIRAATNNFLGKRHSSTTSSSSQSWRCVMNGKDAIVFQRKLRKSMTKSDVHQKLAVISKSHFTSIVKLLGVSISGEHIYLVYEFAHGSELSSCLRNKINPDFTVLSTWMSRLQIATDVAHALDYIHNTAGMSIDMVHKHIKSSAVIVVEPSFNAKICHFGAAELCGETSPEAAAGERRFEGVGGYMSPEFKSTGVATQKSDVYAVGVVILELMTGEEPLRHKFDRSSGKYRLISVIETAREAVEGGSGEDAVEGRLRRWVDKRLKDSFPVDAAEKLTRVALQCVQEDPDKRPEMKWVAEYGEGIWRDSPADIEQIISDYFGTIFTSSGPNEQEIDEVLVGVESRISGAASQLLSLPFTMEEFGSVKPSRGLRQGDPLSPYLFICCAEALIAMIARATERGDFHGVRIAPTAPMISSMCFADDTLIFGQATEEYAATLRDILAMYARVSGQEINRDKSTMCFSPMTPSTRRDAIHRILGFRVVDTHDKYLGMPASIGRTRKEIFSYLRDRVWNRIKGWGEKFLSKAGKEVLIKSVLQAVPAYIMSCFLLPKGLLLEIERAIRRFWWGNGESKGVAWVSWKELCKKKDSGGLGFRDLRAFNMALLMKQAWRILVHPNLLISQILAARYFPHGNLLRAASGSRPSTTWRCIWQSIPLLQRGIRRRIGNGGDTSIWADPWLRDGGNFKILTTRAISSAFPDRVGDLLEPGTNSWNLDLLHNTFWPVDVERILGVPVGGPHSHDSWSWHHSATGQYTVRSGYHMLLHSHFQSPHSVDAPMGSNSGATTREWKLLWRLDLPPKIKVFLWRLCCNNLPTNEVLHRRHMLDIAACTRCEANTESAVHVITTCNGMEAVWLQPPFALTQNHSLSTPWQWFSHLKQALDDDVFLLAMVVAWKTWECRNKEIRNEEAMTLDVLLSWCRNYLATFKCSQLRPHSSLHKAHPAEWKPPEVGRIKINFDAAIRGGELDFTAAAVARDHDGRCVRWRIVKLHGRLNPVEGEEMAALQSIQLAANNGWNDVEFEGDCLPVIQALGSGGGDMLSFGAIIEECLYVSSGFINCSFSFVKRSGNTLANALAKTPCTNSLEASDLPHNLAALA